MLDCDCRLSTRRSPKARSSKGVRSFGEQVAGFTRASWLYQWLTKEPEPAVIVIYLRDTRTIGPMIALMEWLIARLAPYWGGSVLNHGWD